MDNNNNNNNDNNKTTSSSLIARYILHLTSESTDIVPDTIKLLINSITWAAASMAKQQDTYCPCAHTKGQWGHPLQGDCVNNCAVDKTFKEQNIECWAIFLLDRGVKVGEIVKGGGDMKGGDDNGIV